jgi:hypothetical protein
MSREQGAPKGGRGAPARAGDLTPEATIGGRRAGSIRRGTPALNADGRAVLQELGFAHDDVERILRSAAALGAAGVKE